MAGDRAQLLRLFQAHNRVQLNRLTALAPHPQPLFFHLLPLILHGNFKLLPAYTSDDCPAGIVDYQPETTSLRAATSVDRNFQFRRKAMRRYALRGVYLLSSFNGLCYPSATPFDLWLVHSAQLSADAIALLQYKCDALRDWAAELGIKLTTLLVSESDVRLHPEIQQPLDNFYGNGLVIAGSLPLWWLIASDEEADYAHIADRLKAQQHQHSLLDFGAVNPASAETVFDRFITCWYQAFWGDNRNDLVLLLANQQCQSFSQQPDLSSLLKQALETGNNDNMLNLASLQFTALTADNPDADVLQRARQSLYLQTQERLSHKVLHPAFPWRRQFISAAVTGWQWSEQQIRELDQPLQQGLRQLLQQPEKRWQWLSSLLDDAQRFARQHALNDAALKTARQRLALKQQPQAGVIRQLDLPTFTEQGIEQLTLNRSNQQSPWQLTDLATGNSTQQPLYQDKALVNVLAFAIVNGLLTRSSWLRVNDPHAQLAGHHILELSQLLRRSALTESLPPATDESLHQPACARNIILLANLQPAPLDHLQQQGLQMSSKQNDPLSFSSAQTNLVASLDVLLLSSWGQWHHLSFTGAEALSDMLATLLRWQPLPLTGEQITCWCPTASFGPAISQRLKGLVTDLLAFQQLNPDNGGYLVRSANEFWQLQWQAMQVEAEVITSTPLQWLKDAEKHKMASRIDPWLDKQALGLLL